MNTETNLKVFPNYYDKTIVVDYVKLDDNQVADLTRLLYNTANKYMEKVNNEQ